jgi:hypothetical protein
MEMEQQVEGDADAQEVGDDKQKQRVPEPESEEFDEYRGGPHELTVLTKYHVHEARMAADGVVRHYTYYSETLMIVNCC